jgi:hypothetical protein
MEMLFEGLRRNLDVTCYADPAFDWRQMMQIRFGLESGIDVSEYLDPGMHWDIMEKIRKRLEVEMVDRAIRE